MIGLLDSVLGSLSGSAEKLGGVAINLSGDNLLVLRVEEVIKLIEAARTSNLITLQTQLLTKLFPLEIKNAGPLQILKNPTEFVKVEGVVDLVDQGTRTLVSDVVNVDTTNIGTTLGSVENLAANLGTTVTSYVM